MFIFDVVKITEILIFIAVLCVAGLFILVTNIKHWLTTRKRNEKENNRELAIRIIDEFERLLAEKGIKIPNNEREESLNNDEAYIYGSDYYDLEDNIVEILNNKKEKNNYDY